MANVEQIMLISEFTKKTRYCTTCCVEISKGSFMRHLSSLLHLKKIKPNIEIMESKVGTFQYKCPCTPNRLLNMKYNKIHCRSNRHKLYEKYLNK